MSPRQSTAPVTVLVSVEGEPSRPLTIDAVDADHDVRQMLRMLGRPAGERVCVDGAAVAPSARLVDILVQGAVVEIGGVPAEPPGAIAVEVVWLRGPDAGRRVGLRPGRYVLGRNVSGPLATSDPAMAPRHALVEVGEDGTLELTDLGVGRPVTVDGSAITGARAVPPGGVVGAGATVVQLGVPVTSPGTTRDGERNAGANAGRGAGGSPGTGSWTRPYVRSPRQLPSGVDPMIAAPTARHDHGGGPGVIGVVSTGVTLAGGVLMAALFRQPLLLVMVGVGAVGGLVTWIVQAVKARRDRHESRRERTARMARFEREVRARWLEATRVAAAHPTLEAIVGSATSGRTLWSRRASHGDAFTVAIGTGDLPWEPPVASSSGHPDAEVIAVVERFTTLPQVPVTTELRAGAATGIVGDPVMSRALVRSMIAQLVVETGPVDRELLVVAAEESLPEWTWARWLAGATSRSSVLRHTDLDGFVRERASTEGDPERRLVVVVDGVGPLIARTSPLRRLFAAHADAMTLLVIAPDALQLPAICGTVIETAADGSLSLCDPGSLPQRAHAIGCTVQIANRVAAALARWRDPELDAGDAEVAATVDLLELLGDDALEPAAIARRWASAGADPSPSVPLGRAADGLVEIDLVVDGPHSLIAGTTGAGKSELLRSLVAGLALRSSPEALSFLLVDYKGGSAFDACARLPHVVGVVTDLDDRLAERVLRGLEAELRRRERLLRAVGAADLTSYRARGHGEPIARLMVVIDEFAALAAELPEFLHTLVSVAQRGRSLGVHLVLATQRPSGVLSEDIRANTNLRIALRVQDAAEAMDVVGDRAPAAFARTTPGRAALRLGADEIVMFQAAHCTGPAPASGSGRRQLEVRAGWPEPTSGPNAAAPERTIGGSAASWGDGLDSPSIDSTGTVLEALVDAVVQATSLAAVRRPHRPWLSPLPMELPAHALPDGSVGLLDDPDHQAQQPFSWDPVSGHLLLAGALGSGTTTALVTIAQTLAARRNATDLHLYGIDAGSGDALPSLEQLPHTGAIVRLADAGRRHRLLHRLDRLLDDRSAGFLPATPTVVLLVDGFTSVRSTLLDADDAAEIAALERIVQDGPEHGIVVVATIDQPSAAPLSLLARAGERWVFRLADSGDAVALGVAASRALGTGAPAGRCVVSASGLELQVALPAPQHPILPGDADTPGWPEPIAPRPPVLRLDHLAAEPSRVDAGVCLPVGIGDRSGEVERFHLYDGEHVLIVGPARSGRSSALVSLAEQWRRAVPDGWVGVIAPRQAGAGGVLGVHCDAGERQPTERLLATVETTLASQPVLLVVDDAELVPDDAGALGRLLAMHHPNFRVIAAGRPEALRGLYGHWTHAARRSRKGLLLGALHDLDGDLLGVLLPRRSASRNRPGDGYLVADGTLTAVQVAVRELVPA